MTVTPEHVLWAIERECPLRNSNNWADPEQTARELRTLQAYSEALQDGRVFEGICLDRSSADVSDDSVPRGFPLAEIAAAFGDDNFIGVTCRSCPANVPNGNLDTLAGCSGWFPVADLRGSISKSFSRLKPTSFAKEDNVRGSRTVKQGFYALWMNSNWRGARLSDAIALFETVLRNAYVKSEQILRFVTALRNAEEHGLSMRTRLMPQGKLEGKWWHVAEHCPHCHAQWVPSSNQCGVCDFAGSPSPERKRHARGTRPFVPLDKILGDEHVGEFLKRYLVHGCSMQKSSVAAARRATTQPAHLT